MVDSNFRGPINAMGALEDVNSTTSSTTIVSIQPTDGPSMSYQGIAWPDIRSAPFAKDGFRPGQQPAFLALNDFYGVDNTPQAASTTLLAASQAATAGVAFALATAQVGAPNAGGPVFAVGVPIVPGGTTVATTVVALDFGFTTGTTTANSSTVSVADNTQLTLGQSIILGGAANAAGSLSLITQVLSIATANITGITIGPNLPGASLNVPIGQANLYGGAFLPPPTQFGPSAVVPTAHNPNVSAGLARVHNPKEAVARNVSVTAGTTTATSAFLVTGWDIWRQPMSELITVPSGNRSGTTFFGAKAFKYLSSCVPTTTAGGNVSIGVGDVFGVPVRADEWEQTQMFWNGCTVPTSLGFSKAFTTAPATNTTGDVRGTIQVSTNGVGTAAAVATAQVSNGTARLVVIQSPGVWNTVFGTPNNTVPMFGIANSTN